MNALRPASLALVLLTAAALPAFGPAPADADDPTEAQLLVKCKKSEVPHVLAALANRHVRVYDLATMAELHGPGKTGALPSIPDAAAAMKAFRETVRALGGGFRLTEMTIGTQRLSAELSVDGPAAADRLSAQMAESPYFRARATQTLLGALTRKGGRWAAKVHMKFGSPGSSDAPPEGLGSIPLHIVERSALAAGMQSLYASAERRDVERRNRRHVTASREFAFAASTLPKLVALLDKLSSEQGITVTEVRWKREDAKPAHGPESIQKSVVRVATRAIGR